MKNPQQGLRAAIRRITDPITDDFVQETERQRVCDAIIALIEQTLNDCLPKDDIDEELSGTYDLVIPQGVHGFRVALDQTRANLKRRLL